MQAAKCKNWAVIFFSSKLEDEWRENKKFWRWHFSPTFAAEIKQEPWKNWAVTPEKVDNKSKKKCLHLPSSPLMKWSCSAGRSSTCEKHSGPATQLILPFTPMTWENSWVTAKLNCLSQVMLKKWFMLSTSAISFILYKQWKSWQLHLRVLQVN